MSERFAGRFVLLRPLGRGGMGEVFLARDLATGAECAIKRLTGPAGLLPPDALAREFEALTRVRHPGVVAVHEFGIAPEGTPYYTMEYVPGVPADRGLERGDWATLAQVAERIAHGLESLHAAGVLHGDLKPSNVLVVPAPAPGAPPAVRLVDFGLAALRAPAAGAGGASSGGGSGGEPRGHRGTPGYAAPEVVRGEPQSVAGDLYGLGATLYTLAAGRPAFEAEDAATLMRRQQTGPPSAVPLEEAGTPGALVQLILGLMAPSPAERPRDAREVRREIERVHPGARRPLTERLEAATVVGRERELAKLTPGAPRRGRLTLITGGAGAGKSVLLDAIAARASLAGLWVAELSCAGGQGPGAAARVLLRRIAAGALLDPLATEPQDSPIRAALEREQGIDERGSGALADAAASWIRAIAERAGAAVFLLDDSESLDAPSRAFLQRLVLHPGAAAAQWVWAGRPAAEDLAEQEQVLVGAGVAERVELEPLDRDGVGRLAAARLGEVPPPALVEFLWARAGGHPGLSVELLRAAAAAGAIAETESGIAVEAAALERVAGPTDFEASLLARFDSLAPGARAAAVALAAWGRPVEPARLAALDPRADAKALAGLERSGLAVRDAAGGLRLSPPALAPRILGTLEASERRALHQRLLGDPTLSHAERFRHLAAAGDVEDALEEAAAAMAAAPDERLAAEAAALAEPAFPERAAEWHERAAERWVARGRYAAAVPHLERALELDRTGRARPARWEQLARAFQQSGRPQDAERTVTAALAESPPPAWHSRLLSIRAGSLRSLHRLPEALEEAERAAALAESSRDDAAIAVAEGNRAAVLLPLGQREAAGAAAARAAEAAGRCGDAVTRVRAMNSLAFLAGIQRRPEEAESIYREALAVARERGLRATECELLTNLSSLLTELGRWPEARETVAEAARVAVEDGRPLWAALATASLAQLDGLMGRTRASARNARAGLRLIRRYHPRYECFALRTLAQAWRISGNHRDAARAASRALALAHRASVPGEIEWALIELGRQRAAEGRWAEAGALWQRTLSGEAETGVVARPVLATLAGRAALRKQDFEAAAKSLADADVRLEEHPAPYAAALADQLRAELALAQGRADEGAGDAKRCLEGLGKLPAPHDRAMAALGFARLALDWRRESRAPIGDWLDQAASTFERLGDHRNRERALALTVRWLRRSGLQPIAAAPDRNLIEAVSRLLNSLSDFRELTQRAMKMAVEQLDAERGVLLLYDEASGQLSPIAEHGAMDATSRNDAMGYSRRVVRRVTERGGSLLIGDAPSDPRSLSESMVDMRLRSIVCVPMFLGGKVIGAVYLDDSRRPDVFGDADRGLLEGFAQLMAVAIENSRGQEEIRRANEALMGENLSLRQEIGARYQPQNIVGTSAVMQRVLAMAARAAMTSTTVLITGENGTGKELLARVIHHSGKRRLGPFVAVNCGAIPETLIESELFGILASVATGVRARDGRFVQAHGGTLFLDEIGEMPLKQQVALLSAIANREIVPVGGGKAIPVDVRIIAATNRDLARMLQEGTFREDLYYRLNVIQMEVPPLRDRKADIPALAQYFIAHFAEQQEREMPQASAEFLAALMQSDWPGNVRGLQNYIERVLAMSPGPVLYPDPPPQDLEGRGAPLRLGHGRKLSDTVAKLERKLVSEALERARGNQSLAARELGMTEQAIRYKIRKYGLGRREDLRTRRIRR